MYEAHFGFRHAPFGLTPDTRFYFAEGSHQEALNTLLVALRSGEGFLKITGEIGLGKTLLCRQLLNALGPEFVTSSDPAEWGATRISASAMDIWDKNPNP